MVRDPGLREPSRVAGLASQIGGCERTLVRGAGQAADVQTERHPSEDLRAQPRIIVVEEVDGFERALVEANRVFPRHAVERGARRLARALDCTWCDARHRALQVVMRERFDRRTRSSVEELGDLAVEAHALVRAELLEQRLAYERVREAQATRAAFDVVDELHRHRFVEPVDRGVLVDLHDRGHEARIELATEDCGGTQQIVRRVGQP